MEYCALWPKGGLQTRAKDLVLSAPGAPALHSMKQSASLSKTKSVRIW